MRAASSVSNCLYLYRYHCSQLVVLPSQHLLRFPLVHGAHQLLQRVGSLCLEALLLCALCFLGHSLDSVACWLLLLMQVQCRCWRWHLRLSHALAHRPAGFCLQVPGIQPGRSLMDLVMLPMQCMMPVLVLGAGSVHMVMQHVACCCPRASAPLCFVVAGRRSRLKGLKALSLLMRCA